MRRGLKPLLAVGAIASVPLVLALTARERAPSAAGAADATEQPPPQGWLAEAASKLLAAAGFPQPDDVEIAGDDSALSAVGHAGDAHIIDRSRLRRRSRPRSAEPASEPVAPAAASAGVMAKLPHLRGNMSFQRTHDVSASQLAAERGADVARVRRDAEAAAGGALPERFTDAELIRFAVHHGYLRAHTPAEREHALRLAAWGAVETAAWLARHEFASDEELRRCSHLVWWDGPDASGRPTLHIAIGRAMHECRGAAALAFANVVMTQMERAVCGVLADGGGLPGQVNVAIDAAGATTLSASRVAWVLKAVAASLNRHYPGRLHELTLVDLPLVLTWLVRGVKRLVHPETARKVRAITLSGHEGGGASAAAPAEGSE